MRRVIAAGLLLAWAAGAQPKPGAGAIEGQVVHALTGAPVRRATVVLTADRIRLTAETDGEGKFEFTGLPRGSYRLTASRTGFLDRSARRLVAVGNERVGGIEIRLPPQGVIAGRVLDGLGEAADRARVTVFKRMYRDGRAYWDGVKGGSAVTDDRGEYRVSNLQPGRYILLASNERPVVNNRYDRPPNAYYVPVYHPSVLRQDQAAPVEVSAGSEVGGIDIRLVKATRPDSVRIRGRVTGLPADSPTVIYVGAIRADDAPYSGSGMVVRGPDFAFELSAPPGPYTIQANVYSGIPDAWGSERVLVTGEMSGIAVPMRPAPVITGRIRVAEEGATVKLDSIWLRLERLAEFSADAHDLQADASGRFVTRPLRPGRYAMAAPRGIPEGCYIREIRLGEREIAPSDFEIAASGTLEIVLSTKGGRIAGSVVDAEGKAIAGPTVTLIPQDGRSWPAKMTTDETGGFQFGGLRPGKYTLFGWEEVDDDLWQDPEWRRKYAGRAVEVEVKAGEAAQVSVRAIGAEEMR